MTNEELVLLHQQGNKQALESLINNNSGIVRKLATKYNNFNKLLELDDLIQSGTIGLINAANRYDANVKNKASFITYAFQYIEREIYNCVNGRGSKEINNNKFYRTVKSLNVPVGEEENTELLDLIDSHDNSFENVEEQLYLNKLKRELEEAMMDSNTLKEREVLKLYYGWNAKVFTYEEIAYVLNLSKEGVRCIEIRALNKIRKSKWFIENKKDIFLKEFIPKMKINYINLEKKIDFVNEYLADIL